MDEDEALKQYCKRRISLIRSREQHTESPEQGRSKYKDKGASGSKNARHRRQGVVKDQFIDVRRCERDSDQTSPSLKPRKAPEDKPVPVQLMYMLKFKTLNERIRRVRRCSRMTFITGITRLPMPKGRVLFSLGLFVDCLSQKLLHGFAPNLVGMLVIWGP